VSTGIRLLAPVVRKADSAVQYINNYPLDSAIGFPKTYPMDSAIYLSNNRGLVFTKTCGRVYAVAGISDFINKEDWRCRKQQPFGWGCNDSLIIFRISHGEYASKKIRAPDENAYKAGYMKAYLFQRAPSLVFRYEDSEQLTGPTVGCQAALNTGGDEGG